MKETIKNLKLVFYYGRKYKKNFVIFTIMSLTFIAMNIVFPILSAKAILNLTGGLLDQVIQVGLIMFILYLILNINRWILRRNTQIFFRGTTKNIQLDASTELLKMELECIDKQTSGTFIQRINSDTDEMSRIFTRGMGYLTGILTDIGVFVAVFVISKLMFLIYLVFFLILALIHIKKVRKVNEKDKLYRIQREKTSGLISELVRGIRDIKMLNAKDSFMNEVENNIDDLTTSQFKMRNTEMNYNLLSACLKSTMDFLIIIILVILIKNEYLTIASALVIHTYRSRILDNLVDNLGELLMEVKSFNLSCNRVFEIIDSKKFKKEKFGKKHIDKIKGNFEFKNVKFKYDENQVLNDLSFKIDENKTVAFVGKSGAGKTTIFSLLCKLYDVDSGEILIDGINIKDLDEDSIRDNITIISQNPYIFNMSIKDNLRLVKKDLTDEEMKEAIKLACLEDFVLSLKDKYDTIVGEGGVTLSGGQRQRLAIARAFVQNTKIILFDEATSALDNETQKNIQDAINNLKGNYTILIIAHRLSTIISASNIMLIDDGKVIASGTHDELIKNNKFYKELYQTEIIGRK